MKRQGDKLAVFRVPLLLATCSLVGLVSALTGDGWRDMVAWIGLAVPVLAVSLALRQRHA
ncbi:membrane protein [Croceibacterium mercuriale]|uniref:Membrane protein n=1 Tax=Croceibacterium mercuriale TaxID=1572751 RepID=A0A0B2C128_9SPHN|nr:hypothetical protein [Croceibacterium mercuriale]KHL25987.1 membrane protein [Croceibacterium mercuriale]